MEDSRYIEVPVRRPLYAVETAIVDEKDDAHIERRSLGSRSLLSVACSGPPRELQSCGYKQPMFETRLPRGTMRRS